MAVVRDLRVQHPGAVAPEQDVLGGVVAVHEARARVAQLLDERLERGGELGEPLHHGSVIRLEPQLRERLVVAERGRDLGIARRRRVQAAERLAGPVPEAACARPSSSSACQLRQPGGACCSTTTCSSSSLSTTGGTRPGIRRAASRRAAASGIGAPGGRDPFLGHAQAAAAPA